MSLPCWHTPQSTTWPNIGCIGFWLLSGSTLLLNTIQLYSLAKSLLVLLSQSVGTLTLWLLLLWQCWWHCKYLTFQPLTVKFTVTEEKRGCYCCFFGDKLSITILYAVVSESKLPRRANLQPSLTSALPDSENSFVLPAVYVLSPFPLFYFITLQFRSSSCILVP